MTKKLPATLDHEKAPAAKASGRKRNAERSKEQILRAAENLFAQRGYTGVTLDDIARRSGAKRSLILYHFKSKLGLWQAASRAAADSFNAAVTAKPGAPGIGTLAEQRHDAVAAWLDAFLEKPNFPKMLVLEGSTPGPRLDWLIEHFGYATQIAGTSLLKERMTQTVLRDALMAIFLAMSALGPLMEASMAKVTGQRSAGIYPMTKQRRAELIKLLMRILETFEVENDAGVPPPS